MSSEPPVLDPAHAERLNTRCDVVIGTCGLDRRPSLCWGMAGRVHDDRRSVTVWLRRDQANSVLADILATGSVSAVFNVPITAETLQLKGHDAKIRAARDEDAAWVQQHLQNLEREIGLVHFAPAFVRAVFQNEIADLIAIEFTIAAIFLQTPGPQAGSLHQAPHGNSA